MYLHTFKYLHNFPVQVFYSIVNNLATLQERQTHSTANDKEQNCENGDIAFFPLTDSIVFPLMNAASHIVMGCISYLLTGCNQMGNFHHYLGDILYVSVFNQN